MQSEPRASFMSLVSAYGSNPTQAVYDEIYLRYLDDCRRAIEGATALASPVSADAVVEVCAKVADAAKEMRERLFEINGSSYNAARISEAEEIASTIRALKGTFPALDGWRTMDSAPKDGTPFVAINIRYLTGHHITIYKWDGPPNYWHAKQQGTCIRPDYQDDYRWTSIPAAPSTQEADHDNG